MKREETISTRSIKTFPASDFAAPSFPRTAAEPAPGHGSSRHLNKFFKALSDETRREILVLLEGREHTVGEIVDRFSLSQPTISRHLSVLKEANLVTDQRKGQFVVYRLSGPAMARIAHEFFDFFRDCRRLEEASEG